MAGAIKANSEHQEAFFGSDEPDQKGHWFYEFMKNDWHRSTKSNEERMRKPFVFESFGGKRIELQQGLVRGEATLGLTVWDGALVLSKYFELHPNLVQGKYCIELGAGTGLVGIVMGLLGARVIATDMDRDPNVLRVLQENVTQNGVAEKVTVKPHTWGVDLNGLELPFDLVVAADVIFKEDLVLPLLTSMHALCSSRTHLYMCVEKHNPKAIALFERLAKTCFDVQYVPVEEQHPDYNDEQIILVKMRKLSTCTSNALKLCTQHK